MKEQIDVGPGLPEILPDSEVRRIEAGARRIRRHIVEMVAAAGSGHPGGSLSAADILATLYLKIMRLDPRKPDWAGRDRFILSKGHAAPALYAALAEAGYIDEGELRGLRKAGSPLQGHPDCRKVPGVEASTGSLGQGMSIANGIALAGRLQKMDYRVFALLGDGECQEGQVWESAMSAAHWGLDNLMVFLDHNRLQIDGPTDQVMSLRSIGDKFRSFGWNVLEIDGHDVRQVAGAAQIAAGLKGGPTVAVARTVKGKGVSYMEGQADWHGKAPNPEQAEQALRELDGRGECR